MERLAGFEHLATSFAAMASRCREHGCWKSAERDVPDGLDMRDDALPVSLTAVLATASKNRESVLGAAEPVPFVRNSAVDIVCDNKGNRIERRTLKFSNLKQSEPLAYLLDHWRWLRSSTSCQFSDLDTMHLMRARIIGKLHVVNVDSGNPGEFRFELFGYAVPIQSPSRPVDYPVAIWADTVLRDYNTARLTGVPRLQRVRAQLDGVGYHYTRLILPFRNQRGQVERLAVAIQPERGDGVKLDQKSP